MGANCSPYCFCAEIKHVVCGKNASLDFALSIEKWRMFVVFVAWEVCVNTMMILNE